jgi:hypothetical protein
MGKLIPSRILNWRWLWLLVIILALAEVWAFASELVLPPKSQNWVAHPTTTLPPLIDPGDVRWDVTPPFYVPLHAGSHGPLTEEVVELRALYDETTVAFRARWPEEAPVQVMERFALIWHKDDLPGQRGEDCGTACHVARSDSDGGIQTVVPAFVPAGREEPLPTQAVWQEGTWTLTWSRPLHSPEARDVQFIDLTQRYRVRAKVFLDLDHKPDLLTEDIYLIFAGRDRS